MENEQLIQQYLHDRLSPEERANFENQLSKDTVLKEQYDEYQNLKQAIKESERIELKSSLVAIEKTEQEDTQEISFTRRYSYIYAAAAIIIAAIIVFQFLEKEPSPQDLYASYYEPYPNTLQPVVRGDSRDDSVSKGFIAYESAAYDQAISFFDAALSKTYDPNIAFYKAMSLLNLKKTEDALTLITKLKKEETNYRPQLYWYSALIALDMKKREEAISQLDSLSILKSGFKDRTLIKIKDQLTN